MYPSFRRLPAVGRPAAAIASACLVSAWLGACGTAPPAVDRPAMPPAAARDQWPREPSRAAAGRQACSLPEGLVRPGGSFVFALSDSVRPGLAPVPRNRSERLVFAQLYETLVRVDCDGRLAPGLAVQWSCGADSTVWVFTLREDARTWDGERLTAVDVWRSWQENCAAPVDDGATPWNWFDPRTGSVSVLDARHVSVRLPEPQRMFPLLLAHPATAVAVRRPGWTWPVGSGPCRLTQADGAPRPLLTCRPNNAHPRRPTWDALVFRVAPGRDPGSWATDADADVPDLIWTRDLQAVNRLLANVAWHAQALPWDRVHLLVCPPALERAESDRWFSAAAALVPERDVRAASARSWPSLTLPDADGQHCPQLSGPVTADRGDLGDALAATLAAAPTTIVYPQDDPAAQDLARRLAELAGAGAHAVPLSAPAAIAAVRRGEPCASVVPQSQSYPSGCLQLAALLGRATWLQHAGLTRDARGGDVDTVLSMDHVAAPLAVTRAWLLTRGELGGIALHYDACPDLAGLGRLAPFVEP